MDGLFKSKVVSGEPWRCKNGHVLGLVVREKAQGGNGQVYRVHRLYKFRHAVADCAGRQLSELDCRIEGTVLDICCDAPGCEEARPWFMGEKALERLMK